jgi:hypothetical protein
MNGEEFLKQKLSWVKTTDVLHPLRSTADGKQLRVRIGDFPEESMYTLIVDDQPVMEFDDWPKNWARPAR